MALVSIIIPIYNVKKFLKRCLDSVISQTYKNIEIICVNDGSTDGSLKILEDYKSKDDRIRILNQKHLGASAARNIGIENSNGEYIVFVDADDWIEKNLVELAYEKIIACDADIVVYSYNDIVRGKSLPNLHVTEILKYYEHKEVLLEDIADINRVIWDRMIRKKFLVDNDIKFPTKVKNNENGVFDLLCLYKNAKYCCLPQILYNYVNVRKGSLTSNSLKIIKNELQAYKYVVSSDIFKKVSIQLKVITLNKFFYAIQYRYNESRNKFFRLIYNYQISNFVNELSELVDEEILKLTIFSEIKKEYSLTKYLINHIFSVKNTYNKDGEKHKNIILFGIKLKFKINSFKQEIKNFYNNKIMPNTILIVEANDCHGETIPGYAKMFTELGYNVDILCTPPVCRENPLCRLDSKYYNNVFKMHFGGIKKIMQSPKIKDYKYVFFNSYQLYRNQVSRFGTISASQMFENMTNPQKGFIAQEHHLDCLDINMCKEHRILQLGNLKPNAAFCNAHYYGEIKKHEKNNIVKFVIVGVAASYRRNFNLLIENIERLVENNITNFQVNIIGFGNIAIPHKIKKYINILGRLPFDEMYNYIEDSDFILALLDPNNKEHQRYITNGTSGTFQLSYGFYKPIVIQSKFTQKHYFNDKNSIIYDEDFYQSLTKCINMSKKEYNDYVENLKETVEQIEQISLKNLKEVLDMER